MIEGIYSISFRGAADWGMGLLLLKNGRIVGADTGGVKYDGTYRDTGGSIDFAFTLTVPPGATLVQGTKAQPSTYTLQANASIPKTSIETGEPVLLELPPGPVNVIFQHLRSLEF